MGSIARAIEIIPPETYLERERTSAIRHEYVNGVVYAMAGASDRHNRIASNLHVALGVHLPDRCVPYMADMKLRVALQRAHMFYYPDCMVCCGASDQSRDWREDPVVLGEVLSPATERVDRTEKFDAYIRLPTLQEYVLIEQAAARVEVFRRATDWQREVLGPGETLRLGGIDFSIAVDALYRRVEF